MDYKDRQAQAEEDNSERSHRIVEALYAQINESRSPELEAAFMRGPPGELFFLCESSPSFD